MSKVRLGKRKTSIFGAHSVQSQCVASDPSGGGCFAVVMRQPDDARVRRHCGMCASMQNVDGNTNDHVFEATSHSFAGLSGEVCRQRTHRQIYFSCLSGPGALLGGVHLK
eukprot:4587494-Amphidinium_carterae.1